MRSSDITYNKCVCVDIMNFIQYIDRHYIILYEYHREGAACCVYIPCHLCVQICSIEIYIGLLWNMDWCRTRQVVNSQAFSRLLMISVNSTTLFVLCLGIELRFCISNTNLRSSLTWTSQKTLGWRLGGLICTL